MVKWILTYNYSLSLTYTFYKLFCYYGISFLKKKEVKSPYRACYYKHIQAYIHIESTEGLKAFSFRKGCHSVLSLITQGLLPIFHKKVTLLFKDQNHNSHGHVLEHWF